MHDQLKKKYYYGEKILKFKLNNYHNKKRKFMQEKYSEYVKIRNHVDNQ